LRRTALFLLLALGLAPCARAADEAPVATGDVGRSTFVANEVNGQAGTSPPKRVAVNDDILFDEDITTGDEAKTIIEFRDGSTFEIGPDAVVRIDSFVFNPEESTSQKTLQVTRGVFRYVSGYVAANQETKIAAPSGALAIRGSVASGIVDPELPNFIYVGEGEARFSNSAGSTPLLPGNAIAVPSATTAPMSAAAMPAPVAAQALAVIERRLPPREALRNRPAGDEAWLKRQGAADLVPIARQQQREAARAARPLPSPVGRGSLAGELGLLTEANRVGLFRAGGGPRTPEQEQFLRGAARANPNATVALRRYAGEAQTLHNQNRAIGTRFVLNRVGRAASPEAMRRITESSVRANPGAASQIRGAAARAPERRQIERGQVGRGQIERGQTEHRQIEHRQIEHKQLERRPAEGRPVERQQRAQPRAEPRRQPVQNRIEKNPPPKKGDKDKDQR